MMKKIFILFPILILIIYAYSVCAKTDDAQIGIRIKIFFIINLQNVRPLIFSLVLDRISV